MSLTINTNIPSLNAQRNLSKSQNNLKISMERLSSGLRINSAKDDAAGLAISDRMTSQIRGLNQAARNANDGISLAQTAEGAMQEGVNILQRIRELAVQSANDTNSAADRNSLQAEANQLVLELERIGKTTEFNGLQLLDGTFSNQEFQVGANAHETIDVSIKSIAPADLSVNSDGVLLTNFPATGERVDRYYTGTGIAEDIFDGDVVINDINLGALNSDAADIASAIEAAVQNISATANNQTTIDFSQIPNLEGLTQITAAGNEATWLNDGDLIINGVPIPASIAGEWNDGIRNSINSMNNLTGVTAVCVSTLPDGSCRYFDLQSDDLMSGIIIAGNNPANAGLLASTDPLYYSLTLDAGVFGSRGREELDFTLTPGGDTSVTADELTAAIDALAEYSASNDGGSITIERLDGANMTIQESFGTNWVNGGGSIGLAQIYTDNVWDMGFSFAGIYDSQGTITLDSSSNITIEGNAYGKIGFAGFGSSTVTIDQIDISTRDGANTAIRSVDLALEEIDSERANLGAVQNRFESIISNLQNISENLSAARSRILDADIAKETSEMTKQNILQQAGVAILSQANTQPELALSLLQG